MSATTRAVFTDLAHQVRAIASEVVASWPAAGAREQAIAAAAEGAERICAVIGQLPADDHTLGVGVAIQTLLMCWAHPRGVYPAFPLSTRPGRRARVQARRGRLRVVREEAP